MEVLDAIVYGHRHSVRHTSVTLIFVRNSVDAEGRRVRVKEPDALLLNGGFDLKIAVNVGYIFHNKYSFPYGKITFYIHIYN